MLLAPVRTTKTAPAEATYVYAIVKADRALTRLPPGLEGAGKPRVLDAGDGYALVVASAPLARYSAEAIDPKLRDLDWVGARAGEHEAVVEHLAARGTVIPMKLFTLFSTDERAVRELTKRKRLLDAMMERIAGCEEWGLRILFDEARAAKAAAAAARARRPATGKDFLLKKKALEDEKRSAGQRGAAEVHALHARLVKLARRHQRRAAPAGVTARVLLDAVFLVPRPAVQDMQKAVKAAAPRLVEEGFDVLLTGPWPAYSFIGAT